MINDVTVELQGEDKVEKADQVDLVQDTVEKQLQLLAELPARGVFCRGGQR